jgi:ATP-dependent RNA helicase RhlE
MNSFKNYKFLPSIEATLIEKGFTTPTEIQGRALPLLLAGKSIVGVSETGSGKTLAYALPVLHFLKSLEHSGQAIKADKQPRAVVIVPTRELGEQVSKVFKPFTHTTRVRVRTVLGGTSFEVAKRNVGGPFEILVATPGRLIQLLERKLVNLSDVRILVFDEADQMLDQGFLPDARQIVSLCPPDRQLALFSATVTSAVQKLIEELFVSAEVIRSHGSHRVVPSLKTTQRTIEDGKRFPVLEELLKKDVKGGTLIFVNTREQCDKLATELAKAKHKCLIYRGEMDKLQRRNNLKTFREGRVNLLVATDLASRGLDIEHVGRVVNYHMPKHMENYLHRVGRTARAGREGLVINFVTERDLEFVETLKTVAAENRPLN